MTRRDVLKLGGMAALMPAARSGQQRPLPRSEFDYVDWSWERWRDLTKSERPRVKTAQTGVAELLDLRNPSAAPTAPAWPDRRRVISSTLQEFLGDAPADAAPMETEVLDESSEQTHVRRRVRFRAATGEWIPGYLLVPRRSTASQTRGAAVLCPHQTTQDASREPAGLAGNPEQATARHLVDRGFVTLTWDALCFGARHDRATGHYGDAIGLYQRHPRWSLLGKMIADLSRAFDYLATLDFVDAARIGCVGHSHGGITTIFGMALEPRLAAGASNCGFDTFRIDGNVWRWSHATALMPKLGFYVNSPYLNMDRYRAVLLPWGL